MATDAASAPVLERPDLRVGIRSALDSGSLLLIADAGFGKTTALQDALGDGTDAAWVRCRDAGGDAGRLLGLVVEAIRGAIPGAVDVLAERLAAASEPVDPERAAAALESELARLLVDPLVLVVDDAEALEGSQAALAVVARLIAGEGSPLRLAVAARRRPSLRLARERAAGRVAERASGGMPCASTWPADGRWWPSWGSSPARRPPPCSAACWRAKPCERGVSAPAYRRRHGIGHEGHMSSRSTTPTSRLSSRPSSATSARGSRTSTGFPRASGSGRTRSNSLPEPMPEAGATSPGDNFGGR